MHGGACIYGSIVSTSGPVSPVSYAENNNEVLYSLLADSLVYTFSPSRSLNDPKIYDKTGFITFKETIKLAITG